jgi:hypothetical protein
MCATEVLPRVFFDTQICSNFIPEKEWDLVADYLNKRAKYAVSPLTVIELLAGLAKGQAEYFKTHQERLKRLYSPERGAQFFDFIRFFIAKALFDITLPRSATLEDNFAQIITIVSNAKSKEELSTGVQLPGRPHLNLDGFVQQLTEIQSIYVAELQGRSKTVGSPEAWSHGLLSSLEIPFSPERQTKVAEALSAAYHFEVSLLNLARNSNYDLQKNVSDLIDAQQLFYLSDPVVVFVTDDSDHKTRLRKGGQQQRIKTWKELVTVARKEATLL